LIGRPTRLTVSTKQVPIPQNGVCRICMHCSWAWRSNHETGTGLGRLPLHTYQLFMGQTTVQWAQARAGLREVRTWNKELPCCSVLPVMTVKPLILRWTTNSTISSIQATVGHRMHRSALPRKPLSSTVSTAEVGTRNLTCCALCSLMRWPRRTSLFARRAPHTHPSVMGCSWPLTVSFWTALQPRASGHQLAHATATTFARPLRRAALGSPVGGGCVPAVWPPAATLRPWLIPAHRERAPVPPAQKGKAPRPPQQTASVARRRGPRRSSSNPDGAQKGTAEGALGARTVANHFAPAVGCPIKPAQSEKRRALHSKKKKRACPVAPDSAPSNHPSAVQWATKMNQRHRVGRQTWADGRGRGLPSRRPRQFGATRPRCEATLLWGDTPSPRHPAPQPPRVDQPHVRGCLPNPHSPP